MAIDRLLYGKQDHKIHRRWHSNHEIPGSSLLVRSCNCYEWLMLLASMVGIGLAEEQKVEVLERVSIDHREPCTAACS